MLHRAAARAGALRKTIQCQMAQASGAPGGHRESRMIVFLRQGHAAPRLIAVLNARRQQLQGHLAAVPIHKILRDEVAQRIADFLQFHRALSFLSNKRAVPAAFRTACQSLPFGARCTILDAIP